MKLVGNRRRELKKNRIIIIAFALLVGVLGFGESVSAQSRVFYENFEDGNANEFDAHTADVSTTSPHGGFYCGRANWGSTQSDSHFYESELNYTFEIFYRFWIRIDATDADYVEPSCAKFMRIGYEAGGGGNPQDCLNEMNVDTGRVHWAWFNTVNFIDEYVGTIVGITWTKVEIYIKDDDSEGAVKIWINDILLEKSEVPFSGDTHDDDGKWDSVHFPSNWVGRGPEPNYVYFDDVEIYSDICTGATGSMEEGTITVSTDQAPSISSINQSSVSNGDSITISGSEFGLKSQAAPVKWDDFENGTAGDTITGWSNVVGEMNHLGYELIPRYSNNNSRTGQGLNYQVTLGPNDESTGCYVTEHVAPFTKAFVSFWLRFSWGHPGNATGYQIKLWRITSENYGLDTARLGNYVHYQNGTGVPYYATVADSFYGGVQYPEDVWVLVELQAELSSPGGYDGVLKLWNSRESGQIIKLQDRQGCRLRLSDHDWQNFIFGQYLTTPIYPAGYPMTEISTILYYDDIYIDNSWARVVIGDNSTYPLCTHREIQIPTNWSNNSITFTVNQGSFLNGTAYLFVVDENGNVSDGYPITFGASSSTTHKADINDDGLIDMIELIAYITRWKANDGVSKTEVWEARGIWFRGGAY